MSDRPTYEEPENTRRALENRAANLEQQLEQYKRLVESLSGEYIFYAHDTSGMITYLSPSIYMILVYSQEEGMRNFKEFLTDHEMNEDALMHSEESLNGNIQPPFMNEVYHRDGSTRIFYNTEIPIYDENGEISGVEGIAHDITKRMAAEEELRKQEEIFNLLVDTIEEVFWIQDLQKNQLLYISPKYTEVYGRSIKSLYHNPGSFLKAVHPDDREFVIKAYRKIAKGKGLDLEYRITGQGDTEKLIWSRSFVLRDDRKRPSLSIGTAQDITGRKKAQKEKDMLAAIVENVEDHAVIKDTLLKIIASNPANTRAAGKKSADEMIGKTDLEIYGDTEHVRQYMEDDLKVLKMKKGKTLVNDQVFVYPDGQKIHSLVKKFPVYDDKNNLIAVASISRDMTDLRKAGQEIKESELELRETIAAKDRFFSIIAHDLKNPLNSILGFSELLLKDFSGYDKEEILTFLRMINSSSKQVHNLLENLLNWSGAQTGRMIFEPGSIDVHSAVESVFLHIEGNAWEKNLVIMNMVRPGTLVYADENMVRTILRNLISNAVKFTRPKGKITVRSRNHKECIDILVTDNGIGIPEDILGNLFRIDKKVTRSGTANEEGTGLGLILCKEFAEKNNGSIKVISKAEKGSTFSLRLPRPGKQK